MVGADKIITKTREEATGIPTKEANAKTVANTQYSLRILNGLPKISDEEEEEAPKPPPEDIQLLREIRDGLTK